MIVEATNDATMESPPKRLKRNDGSSLSSTVSSSKKVTFDP